MQNITANMKEEAKTYYETPATTVVEVKIEGVIATSAKPQSYNNPFGKEEVEL